MDESWYNKTQRANQLICSNVATRTPAILGSGVCSFPKCYGGGGFKPCQGYTGAADECLNCQHPWNYHA